MTAGAQPAITCGSIPEFKNKPHAHVRLWAGANIAGARWHRSMLGKGLADS